MWRQHDVIFTLGGGIDHVTRSRRSGPRMLTNKITDYYLTMAPLAPLMHGAAQWGVLGPLFVGTKIALWTRQLRSARRVAHGRARTGQHHLSSPATPWRGRSSRR